MSIHQFQTSAYKRLLQNDTSDNFSIIIKIKSIENRDENFMIENQNQIIIRTTINKARVISKTIDEMFSLDPTIKQFEFEIKNTQNMNQAKPEDVLEIFQMLLKSINEEITISGDKQEIFLTILHILCEEYLNSIPNLNQNEQLSNEEQQKGNKMNKFQCEFEGDELSGIISCIQQMTGGNLDGIENIKLSAGGGQDQTSPLTNIVKYDKDHINQCFYNFNIPVTKKDGWIEFDFLDRKVQITSYTIRTNFNYQFYNHPKSWKIIGSNDELHWDLIDIQNDREEMNGISKQHRYICNNKKNDKSYRFVRYVQLDIWGERTNKGFIYLACIEFFGSIFSSQ